MTGKTHMLGGLAAGTGMVLIAKLLLPEGSYELTSAGLFMASSTMTALLPDVDEKNSTAGRKLIVIPITLFLLKACLLLMEYVSFGNLRKKFKETRKALNHRGLFHWLITWIILSAIGVIAAAILIFTLKDINRGAAVLITAIPVLVGFIPGYLSHLLFDLISGRIQLFAPFSKKWYGVRIFKVGGFLEIFVFRPILMTGIVYMLLLLVK